MFQIKFGSFRVFFAVHQGYTQGIRAIFRIAILTSTGCADGQSIPADFPGCQCFFLFAITHVSVKYKAHKENAGRGCSWG